MNMTKSIK